MDTLIAALPIVLLIILMTMPRGLPSYRALPLMAVMAGFLALAWFHHDPLALQGAVVSGFVTALTPILIMGGALFLFRTMETTGALGTIVTWLESLTTNRVALAMIVGWAFSFLLEGAGGFGTPIALAAPILVGLGFPPLKVAIMTLIMNSVPVTFGAVGTPVWFGLSRIPDLPAADILAIGIRSALLHGAASLVVPLMAMLVLVPWKTLRKSIGFVYLSVAATVVPYIAFSFFSYEFPSLAGGLIGLLLSGLFAKLGWGLEHPPTGPEPSPLPVAEQATITYRQHPAPAAPLPATEPALATAARSAHLVATVSGPLAIVKAGFPLWGTTLVLIVTRLPFLPLKHWLESASPALTASAGTLGILSLSPSLVVGITDLFGLGVNLSHKTLYVPSLIPFGLVALLGLLWYRAPPKAWKEAWTNTIARLAKPSQALFGALILVEILMLGGQNSAVNLMGRSLAAVFGGTWQFVASYLGALGAFFSGSNTVANLTFGGIQDTMARSLGLDRVTILALQATGGAYGHMVALGPVISAATILGLKNQEGAILRGVFPSLVVYGLVVGAVSWLF